MSIGPEILPDVHGAEICMRTDENVARIHLQSFLVYCRFLPTKKRIKAKISHSNCRRISEGGRNSPITIALKKHGHMVPRDLLFAWDHREQVHCGLSLTASALAKVKKSLRRAGSQCACPGTLCVTTITTTESNTLRAPYLQLSWFELFWQSEGPFI